MTAVDCHADALGFIFAESKRRITPAGAAFIIERIPIFVKTVGVFMNSSLDEVRCTAEEAGVDVVQLHGEEPPDFCSAVGRPVIKRIHVRDESTVASIHAEMDRYQNVHFLLDPGAGDGRTFPWNQLQGIGRPFILAGGLTPDNVWEAIQLLQPYAVDVSSGVEVRPGKKDPDKIRHFIQEAK
ncbi:phosphoribosylanthranilate isomerase [bacterium]|nr:phosphoribosylanthranilate isomerase [bacterium]